MTDRRTGVPGVQRQLTGARSGPYDCVVRGGVNLAATWASGRAVRPRDPSRFDNGWRSSRPDVGATIDQAKRGFASYADVLEKEHGLRLRPMRVRDEDRQGTTRRATGIRESLEAGERSCCSSGMGRSTRGYRRRPAIDGSGAGIAGPCTGSGRGTAGPRRECSTRCTTDEGVDRTVPYGSACATSSTCAAAFRQGGDPARPDWTGVRDIRHGPAGRTDRPRSPNPPARSPCRNRSPTRSRRHC